MEKGPQFKVFHGDQGTLFNQQEHAAIMKQRVIPDEDRYPRGFTPERYRAVRDVFKAQDMQGRIYGGYTKPHDTDIGGFDQPENREKERGFLARRGTNAKVIETIARSTAPIEHLAEDTPSIWIQGSHARDGAAGRYFSHDKNSGGPKVEVYNEPERKYPQYDDEEPYVPTQKEQGRIKAKVRQDQEQTLIHELGHHASNVTSTDHWKKRFSYPQESPHYHAASGAEEAFADDYKDTHWKPDPRDKMKGWDPRPFHAYDAQHTPAQNPYIKGDERGAEIKQSSFAEGYEKNRKARPEYKTLNERYDAEREEERNPSNPPLFEMHPADRHKTPAKRRVILSSQFRWSD